MAFEVVVPRLGWSMEEGVFVRWLKRDGETVRPGDMLFELEGEKALQEIEAVDGGILRIPTDAPAAGSTVQVGQVLGYLVAEGEVFESATIQRKEPEAAVAKTAAVARGGPRAEAGSVGDEGKAATPRARRVARELNVDWKEIAGSGANGRVRERDVRAAAASSHGKRVPISHRRRTIAERMITSREQTVPVTLTTRADATALVALRERFKQEQLDPLPSYQDILVKLAATALARHPLLAAQWNEDAYVLTSDDGLHIGIAVDTDDGLLVPVIRGVLNRSFADIAAESRRLIERSRAGKVAAADLQGGLFTITNLGAFGIDAFTPVINWPEVAILGLGAIRQQTYPADNQIAFRPEITLSLSFDHRRLDGAPAARFLHDLVEEIAGISVD
jgi:pyruvate dehydrogenase E2 component (dihydrolipoamide acetyltransferase)